MCKQDTLRTMHEALNILSLYWIQLNICQKKIKNDHIMFSFSFTQRHNFFGIELQSYVISFCLSAQAWMVPSFPVVEMGL